MEAKIVQITSFNPIFKGVLLLLLACSALFFAYYMRKKWKEQPSSGFYFFIGLAVFIFIFGLFILTFKPNWWALPY